MNLLADSLFVGTKEMKNYILGTKSSYTSFNKEFNGFGIFSGDA